MENYSKIMFQILKAIDESYENGKYDKDTLNLERLNISEKYLELLLGNLIEDGYIKGIKMLEDARGNLHMSIQIPKLTSLGLIYLEKNSEEVLMKNYSKITCQILKAINESYENGKYDRDTLNLERLNISKKRLDLLIENLIEDGYIKGIRMLEDARGNLHMSVQIPKLTTSGLIYLEKNSMA